MYLAFNAPHDPRQAPQEYLDKYPLKNVAVPETFLEEYPYHEEMGAGKKLRDERLAPYPRTPYSIQVHRKEYYALISHMDTQIGKILDALEATGEMDNTYIVFTADHGLSVGQHGLLGKQNMYDHSVRVPFYVIGPDVPKGKTIDTPIYLQDVMPTTLEWAQQDIPQHVEFSSLVPLIQGKGEAHLPYIYGAYTENQRMVRTDSHKLIWYPKAEKIRLFDLKKDPLEQNDVADDANYAEVKTDLIGKLQTLQQQMHDPIPAIGK
jgi:choline-sulfatase